MTATVIFRTDSKLKSQAQKTAENLGLTLTSVMNGYLEDFVQDKTITFGSKKKTFTDPYGMFAKAKVTEKDLKEIADSWMKSINKIG